MINVLRQLSDHLLSKLVPKVAADAGCVTDPYTYYNECSWSCWTSGAKTCCYFETCHVYSNCTTHCVGYCNVQGCW